MSARVYRTTGIIIKRHKFGEADRLLTIFTADCGKVRAIAKGAMRPRSKLGGNVELLTHSQLVLARGRNLDIVTQAQALDIFLPMRDSLELMSCGFYLAEMVDNFTEENVEDRDMFGLFLDTLRGLSETGDGERIVRYFELRLLGHLGYSPQLQKCANCNNTLQPETNYYNPAQGGVLCRECGYPDMSASTISVNALKVLRLWQRSDVDTASRVKLNAELTREIKGILRYNVRYVLEKQLKSIEWMDRLANGNITLEAPLSK
ncbi:MAG: DNA repair protein RecO [Chloroflexi bacterium]|jgi:DNA repair protein RecO (recombination protein O)|nr:DNA repair protein RecO [Chloroflexota bacterium]